MRSRAEIVDWARSCYEDLDFLITQQCLDDGQKAAGFLPVYAPREIIHAAGMLPVGIYGGGDQIEIIRGDAYYQSYICHLPRSVIELAHSGKFDFLDAMLFPSTCDVIRNLSGMWQVMFPDLYVRYLDLPHVREPSLGGAFWEGEMRTLLAALSEVAGTKPSDDDVRASIVVYNEVRQVLRDLYNSRRDEPWRIPSEELYLLLRAGEVVDPQTFIDHARAYLRAVHQEEPHIKDRSRVIVVGAFCEQPPLGLIKTIERAGCYIVDDDFIFGNRLISCDIPIDGDPVKNLSAAFIGHSEKTSVLYEPDPKGKKRLMKERATAARADGIIFAAASFCDPALLDRPMLRAGAEANSIPCIAFKYSENTGQFQQFREQAGTFSDSIKLWGGV